MAKKEFTAIVFFCETGEAPHKYRKITDLKNFEAYCIRKLTGSWYINYYEKETKNFSHRAYLK